MDSFYSPPRLISRTEALIEGEEFEHLTHVMRKATGDSIRVVDGEGVAFDAVIVEVGKRKAKCALSTRYERLNEPDVHLTLAVGILKNPSRFDFLVEKAVELGAGAIVPLLTERTIPRHARENRWQKLAFAAMKQSGRCILPKVLPLQGFQEFIGTDERSWQRIILHEGEHRPLPASVDQHLPVVVCVGPEGGFSDSEIGMAVKAGWSVFSLGPRRLRTETAAVMAAGLLIGGS